MKYYNGHYYHLYNRGCNQEPIFTDTKNYTFLLYRIKAYREIYPVSIIAYCLMPNHYHFLVRPEADDVISPFMQRLFNSYTQAYNKQQQRSGTIFQGRYQSVLVEDDAHLRHLCRYIHLNPVEARLVQDAGKWPFSNYREFVGLREGTLVDSAFVSEFFGSSQDYVHFVRKEISAGEKDGLTAYKLD